MTVESTSVATPTADPWPMPAAAVMPAAYLLPSHLIRFSQADFSGPTHVQGIQVTLAELVEIFENQGYISKPISVVEMPDGALTSLDNRRLWAALEAGLEQIPAVVRGRNEAWHDRLQRESLQRHAPLVDDGGAFAPAGTSLMEAGQDPDTYLLGVLRRCANQSGPGGEYVSTETRESLSDNDPDVAEIGLGELFADHLRFRTSRTAVALADALADAGETRRADCLRDFVLHGAHTVEGSTPIAEGASPANCHLGLLPPAQEQMRAGDLWFDPLEVSWSVAVPWPHTVGNTAVLPPFYGWFALDPAARWQLYGAGQLCPDTPAASTRVTGHSAWTYCTLFGKRLAGWSAWGMVDRAFGQDAVHRLWGESHGEIGIGGNESDLVHLIAPQDLPRLPQPDGFWPDVTYIEQELDLNLRCYVHLQEGLCTGVGTIERTWTT